MEKDIRFENAIDSPSYNAIKEAVIKYQDKWITNKDWNQEKFAKFILDCTEGITVLPTTVSVYVGDVLKRLGIKDRFNNDIKDNPYKEEELRNILNNDELCFRMTMDIVKNIHTVGVIVEEDIFKIYDMNKNILK